MREMLMWTCSRDAANSIHLWSECSVNNSVTLSVWNRYFKEKYVYNAGCMFNKANAKRTTFWHSFSFASVPYASFAFAYRYRHTFKLSLYSVNSVLILSRTRGVCNLPYFYHLSPLPPYRHVCFNLPTRQYPVISVHM